MTIYADSPDIAKYVIKCHKEANKMKVITFDWENEDSLIGKMAKIVSMPADATDIKKESIGSTIKILGDTGKVELNGSVVCLRYGSKLEILPDKKIDSKPGVSVILFVAKMIADCKIRDGVANHEIHAACPQHPLSGLQRLRELAKRFTLSDCCWLGIFAYEYRHNRYYPTAAFKKFCKQFIKNRLASS